MANPIKNKKTHEQAGVSNSFPQPLNKEEEAYFLNLYAKGCHKEKKLAKNTLIERNLRLVAHIVKKFHNHDVDDLISIGTIGLIKGISSYNIAKDTKLATYAARCIENEIRMYLRSIKKHAGNLSIQDVLGTDAEGNSMTFEDKLADDGENLLDAVVLKMQVVDLYKALDVLDPREKEIIQMRYGLENKEEVTQREIGQMLKISRSYVSRIEKKALEKLFKELEKRDV
ncbi:MAG: RNA polymerase sporulation sigma factor SigK [Defluviitaleaceae bacterium]|nr:RNA polymerase sporulation sigma factor SigK [Defluviitaleaceae bacterium]